MFCQPSPSLIGTQEPGAGLLEVTLLGAAELVGADVTGTSDPYVTVRIGDAKVYKSATIKATTAPQWNETFEVLVDDLAATQLVLQVKDWNVAQVNKVLGTLVLQPAIELQQQQVSNLELVRLAWVARVASGWRGWRGWREWRAGGERVARVLPTIWADHPVDLVSHSSHTLRWCRRLAATSLRMFGKTWRTRRTARSTCNCASARFSSTTSSWARGQRRPTRPGEVRRATLGFGPGGGRSSPRAPKAS